jgi:hypothetical protein
MAGLDWNSLEAAELSRDPFDHLIVGHALTQEAAAAIPGEFPAIRQTGSIPIEEAPPGPVLAGVIREMRSPEFRALLSKLFNVDLEGRPVVMTLRGQCGPRDGRIHVDSASKILSLLLYLNDDWSAPDGRLRLLRADRNLAAPAVEIVPSIGTLLVFRRSGHSWHGHTPFIGQRRVLQMNYLKTARDSMASTLRHRLSAIGKRLVA